MLEYTLEDAKALLEKNHETAMKNLAQVHHDLDFLRYFALFGLVSPFNITSTFFKIYRDQMTTTEVNMARLYNWDVKRRQALNAK
jgi:hypothetical protein